MTAPITPRDLFTDEDVQRVAVKLWDFCCPGLNPAWADEVAYRLFARDLLSAGTERLRAEHAAMQSAGWKIHGPTKPGYQCVCLWCQNAPALKRPEAP